MIYERGNDIEIRLTSFINKKPKTTLNDLKREDDYAMRTIENCGEIIEFMQNYRAELAERAKALCTMQTSKRITLKRERSYSIKYRLTLETVYEDGTAKRDSETVYAGAERHKAIREYNDLCKQYRAAEKVKDIEIPKWEHRR